MTVSLVLGDITDQQVDAIVNAANGQLVLGAGVAGAIRRRGGPAVQEDCDRVRRERYPGGVPTGEAVATVAGDLPARWVIHAVGPVHGVDPAGGGLLTSCYARSLRVADRLGARSVAFPAISTGVYGWPVDDAARIAVAAVRSAEPGLHSVDDIRFVLWERETYDLFAAALGPG